MRAPAARLLPPATCPGVLGDAVAPQVYPALLAHHAKIAALPAIAAYLASPLRLPK